MLSNSNNNNITNYNISNDWGWFFDIENNSYINHNTNIHCKKIVNKLPSIEEEYNYYKQNHTNLKCSDFDFDYKEVEEKSVSKKELICKIGSTTFITVLLAYSIYSSLFTPLKI